MFTPNPNDEKLIHALYVFPFLTVDQAHTFWGFNTLKYSSARLKLLTEKGYLYRPKRPHITNDYLYMLGVQGKKYLIEEEYPLSKYFPSEQEYPHLSGLPHSLGINEVMLAAHRLGGVKRMFHDIHLKKRMGLKLVRPDALIHFQREDTDHLIWLEYDTGKEDHEQITRKLMLMFSFMEGDFVDKFGEYPLSIAFVTLGKVERRDTLVRLIDQALQNQYTTRQEQDHYASIFSVASIPEGVIDPQWFFLEPHWSIPRRTNPYPLLIR